MLGSPEEETIRGKICGRHRKSMGTFSDTCGCNSGVTLASVDELFFFNQQFCHIQVQLSGNYIPAVISSPNYTSLPSTVATFLTTCLMAVLQPSRYSVFHNRDTPIQLGLL